MGGVAKATVSGQGSFPFCLDGIVTFVFPNMKCDTIATENWLVFWSHSRLKRDCRKRVPFACINSITLKDDFATVLLFGCLVGVVGPYMLGS